MKPLFLLTFLTLSNTLFSQDTTTVEQYGEVIFKSSYGDATGDIIIDYGKERFQWYGYKNEKGRYIRPSIINALNFMGKQGWKLINTFDIPSPPSHLYNSQEIHFIFKKEMLRSALNDQHTD
jgi:hypothetical protein